MRSGMLLAELASEAHPSRKKDPTRCRLLSRSPLLSQLGTWFYSLNKHIYLCFVFTALWLVMPLEFKSLNSKFLSSIRALNISVFYKSLTSAELLIMSYLQRKYNSPGPDWP
jgi:hypothetical protein